MCVDLGWLEQVRTPHGVPQRLSCPLARLCHPHRRQGQSASAPLLQPKLHWVLAPQVLAQLDPSLLPSYLASLSLPSRMYS